LYLSSNTPWALSFLAFARLSSSHFIGRACFIFSFTKSSTFFISSLVSFLLKLKSNLNLSGVMLLPF